MIGKNVLVTGGLGNLGSWISKYLVSKGYNVFILSRKHNHYIANTNTVKADITDINELKRELNFNIDYCIHTASFNEFFKEDYPTKALIINALGTRNLLEVLNHEKLKNFIYLSTFHVYGAEQGIINEKSELNPKNDYASTHLFAEYYIKQFTHTHNVKYTILRLTNSYGAPTFFDSDKWYLAINDLTKSAFEKNKIILKSNGTVNRDFIYMGDVCSSIEKIMQKEATNEIYNLSSEKTIDILTLSNLVKDVYDNKYNTNLDILVNINDKTRSNSLKVENTKLKKLIDIDFKDNLKKVILNIIDMLESNQIENSI